MESIQKRAFKLVLQRKCSMLEAEAIIRSLGEKKNPVYVLER